MTPQSCFTVVAPIAPGRVAGLRALLDSMNVSTQPGNADPFNTVLPLGDFDRIHFARFLLLQDETLDDIRIYGLPPAHYPEQLVFMGECDGPAGELLAELVKKAGSGLRRIFSHCDDFEERTDLLAWLCAHDVRVATSYVNWVGRTVRQIKEESALQRALSARIPRDGKLSEADVQRLRHELIEYVDAEIRAGRLSLTPAAPTPLLWQLRNCLHALWLPAIGLITLPLAVALLPFALLLLRHHEKKDVEYCPRPAPAALQALKRLEDHDVSNQFSALGSLKPGLFRRGLITLVLWFADYTCRHVANRGHLGRVQTIHFARWVFIDNRRRVMFASNYDGGHEAYMDDFVNKVAWGLNATFSHGVGWPTTNWLLGRGARRELKFKYFQRRHQIPSQVWYKAYPALSLTDLNHNQKIRKGLEQATMTQAEALVWLKLL